MLAAVVAALLTTAAPEGVQDSRDTLARIERVLGGDGPESEKRAALGELCLLAGEEPVEEVRGRMVELASRADVEVAGRSLGAAVRGVLLAPAPGQDEAATRAWLRARLDAALLFQAAGDYGWASAVLDSTAPFESSAEGLMAVELCLLSADVEIHHGSPDRAARACDRLDRILATSDLGAHHVAALGQAAWMHFKLGQYSAMRRLLEEGLARSEETGVEPFDLWLALGLLSGHEGQHAQAVGWFSKRIAASRYPIDEAGARINRGRERRKSGDPDGAQEDFERALEIAGEQGFQHIEAAARDGLALLHLAAGRIDEAEAELETLLAIERRLQLVDYLPHSLQTLAKLALERGQPERAFEAMAEAERHIGKATAPRALAELRSRFAEWSAIAQDAAVIEARVAAREAREAAIQRGLWQAEQWSGRALLSAMRVREGLGLDLDADELVASLADVPGPHRAVVRFAAGRTTLRAYVLLGETIELVELGALDAIEAEKHDFVERISSGPAPAGKAARAVALGAELFEHVIAPVLARAPATVTELVVVPSEALADVPFEALVADVPAGADEPRFDSVRFLVEDYSVVYAPSLAILAHLVQLDPPVRGGKSLFLGDVTVPTTWGGLPDAHRLSAVVNDLSPLPASRTEVIDLAWRSIPPERREPHYATYGRLKDPDAARDASWSTDWFDLFLGAAASRVALAGGERYDLMHVASHSFADEHDPAYRGLVLSGRGVEEDGLLDMADIRALELDASLVVLSGCSTGSGRILGGEGVQSTAAAFLEAGGRNVIASLWAVDDRTTERLMRRFYANLAGGDSAQAALAEAKRHLWSTPPPRGTAVDGEIGSRHPFRWAPFVFIGSPH